ncbi:MAG: FixH family protein [Deltaproteobacteria bacterium]|nr:FixH family protein [Deltaproteobacteria bacterium]MBI3016646.1 FixH family protein [Deltaproteobacteria bacterium]
MKKILVFFTLVWIAATPFPIYAHDNETHLDPAEATTEGRFLISSNWSQLKRGWNVLVLQITNTEGQALSQANVKVSYEMEDMEMNPPDNPVEEKENGTYEKKIFLGMKGNWKFDATLEKDDVKDTLAKVIKVVK